MAADEYPPLPASGTERPTRRAAALSVGRAVLTSTTLVILYFVLPVTSGHQPTSGLALLGIGLTGFVVMLAWQVRSIIVSRAPWLRAIEVLATALPMFLLLFSMTYFVLAKHKSDAFGSSLTRMDALYFTVTVFATVGFGDIAAKSETARAIVTVQMVTDLIVIGIGIRVLLGAVRMGLERQGRNGPTADEGQAPDAQPPLPRQQPAVDQPAVSSGPDDAG